LRKKKRPFLIGNVITWLRRNGLLARLHASIANHVPVGYEDETGFHIGMKTPSDLPSPVSGAEFGRF
jgi:hypothetical protein